MTQQVYGRARELADVEAGKQEKMLQILCWAALTALSARLRPEIAAEEYEAPLVEAASLYALAALWEVDPVNNCLQVRLGDMTLQPDSKGIGAQCLRQQADKLLLPYSRDGFIFQGV